jgi:dynactin complex subunit
MPNAMHQRKVPELQKILYAKQHTAPFAYTYEPLRQSTADNTTQYNNIILASSTLRVPEVHHGHYPEPVPSTSW